MLPTHMIRYNRGKIPVIRSNRGKISSDLFDKEQLDSNSLTTIKDVQDTNTGMSYVASELYVASSSLFIRLLIYIVARNVCGFIVY